jgi:transcriptional regulator with XRE-family HTH domain
MTVSDAARSARKRKGITREHLSKISGVPVAVISRIERGKTNPRLSSVELLADALGLSIDEYVGHSVIKSKQVF